MKTGGANLVLPLTDHTLFFIFNLPEIDFLSGSIEPFAKVSHNSPFDIFNRIESEFLVRQAKPGKSSWLKSQPDKVCRPSEPSFASMRVTVWVKRKQGDSRP